MGRFPRLTDDQLDLTTDAPDFMGDITNDLGNLGTHTDGFEVVFEDLVTQIGNAGDVGSALDDDLDTLGTSVPQVDPNSLDSDRASLPATLSEGNAILSESSDLLGTITPTPQPPGGGGGGGAVTYNATITFTFSGPASPQTLCISVKVK
jgi:hypothetical protein